MEEKKNRRLKVYSQSNGYNYQDVPTIVLKDKWLAAAGFNIDDGISVQINNGSLHIERVDTTGDGKNN